MKRNFASVTAMLALAATTALTTVSAFGQAAYPQGAPPPSSINDPANNNYAPVPNGYYGTPMTQQGVNAVVPGGPKTLVLYYARKGFTDATLPDGEHIGIEFNLDPNTFAYVERSYDLNNPDQLELYNENVNADFQLDTDRQAMYEAGRWNGPGFYFGTFNPCWGRDRGFELIIGAGGREVIFADPYRLEVGFPFIIEPVFGFGFGRGFDRIERERRIEFERERFHERFNTFYGNRFPGREIPGVRGTEGRREIPGARGTEGRRDVPGIPRQDPRYPATVNPRTEHQQSTIRPVPSFNPNVRTGSPQIQHSTPEQRGGREVGGRETVRGNAGRQVSVPVPGHRHG